MFASAVLLHLSREQFADVLVRAAAAARVLAFDVKEGDGAGWTEEKLGLPRHFTYWRADGLRAALDASPWQVRSMRTYRGARADWFEVLASRP